MKSKKAVKSALGMSVLSIALCMAMLIGTTFAWFTDTASASVSKIQAGTLDVALEMKDADGKWVNAEGKTLNFVKAAGHENEAILWEPGCTYELPQLRIRNDGNLALKYKVAITGISGDSKLNEVLDWYYNDTLISKASGMVVSEDAVLNAEAEGTPFTIKAHMQETAGNDYQNLSISGIAITVYATQAAVEFDSNGSNYDANAEYLYVEDEAALKAALTAGKSVIFNNTIELTDILNITSNVEINGNGNALITGKPVQIAAAANVTFRNVEFQNPVNHSSSYEDRDVGSNLLAGSNATRYTGKLVVDGCTFAGSKWDCIQAVVDDGAEVVINRCRFELNEAAPAGNKTRFIHIEAAKNSNADVKVALSNNYFGASTHINEALIDIDYINLAGIDFGGNNVYTDTDADIYVCGSSVDRTISKDDAYKALGSKAASAGTQNELNDAINAAGSAPVTVTLTTAGTYTLPSMSGKDVTIAGTKDTVINMENAVNNAKSIAFDGVTVNFGTANYKGFQHTGNVEFKNCVLNGFMTTYGDTTYEGCTFNSGNDQYAVNVYGGETFTFKNCHFYGVNKNIYIYQETLDSDKNVTVTNCDFHMSGTSNTKSAVMLNAANNFQSYKYNLVMTGCSAEGTNATAGENVAGKTNYQGLYGLKHINGSGASAQVIATVTIDGAQVYTHTAG